MLQMPSPSKRYRVCLLEDDVAVSDALRLSLERQGYEVTSFGSASDFLVRGQVDTYDCLVVDQHLPLLSGLELVELLRRRAYSKPAVLIWGQPVAHLLPRIRRAAINETLTKPLSPENLVAAVLRAISCPGDSELRT
ncbi:MAG: response regulator [Alphaproteobacteria bacterium]|nr:response regulator [Alphaproteobacteria bacterium]MBL6937724.1 response regulator [Alphaproteobacteria bacterium]MBL7099062.1 response regulator [Alphaproteobacteria bacterium]